MWTHSLNKSIIIIIIIIIIISSAMILLALGFCHTVRVLALRESVQENRFAEENRIISLYCCQRDHKYNSCIPVIRLAIHVTVTLSMPPIAGDYVNQRSK